MKLANIPSDIKRTARELKIPVLQHHIYVNGRHKHVTISKKCVRKAGLTEKYSVQIVVLGEVRAYMIFSYDPLCENRPHLLFLPSSCEIHSPYVTRALQRIGIPSFLHTAMVPEAVSAPETPFLRAFSRILQSILMAD